MMNIAHGALRGLLYNRPLLLAPDRALVLHETLSNGASFHAATSRDRLPSPDVGYDVVDGIAVVPVIGTLVQRFDALWSLFGLTGYDAVRAMVADAVGDARVEGIALRIDSPGGGVAGCFGLCDYLARVRQSLPVWAIVDELAASAAYAIASQADRVIVAATGEVGSVGVVAMHTDLSAAMAARGMTVTLVHAGAHKVDGNPYQALSEPVRADWQRALDEVLRMFAARVARGRGLSVERVLATEARMVSARDAVAEGLADAVMWPEDALAAFRAALDGDPVMVAG